MNECMLSCVTSTHMLHQHTCSKRATPQTKQGSHQQTPRATRIGAQTIPEKQGQATAAAGARSGNVSFQLKGARRLGGRQSWQPGASESERSAKSPIMKEALVTAIVPAAQSPRAESTERAWGPLRLDAISVSCVPNLSMAWFVFLFVMGLLCCSLPLDHGHQNIMSKCHCTTWTSDTGAPKATASALHLFDQPWA
jgi:hypothetical protein